MVIRKLVISVHVTQWLEHLTGHQKVYRLYTYVTFALFISVHACSSMVRASHWSSEANFLSSRYKISLVIRGLLPGEEIMCYLRIRYPISKTPLNYELHRIARNTLVNRSHACLQISTSPPPPPPPSLPHNSLAIAVYQGYLNNNGCFRCPT